NSGKNPGVERECRRFLLEAQGASRTIITLDGNDMTIKSRQHQINSSDVAEPTQVLVAAAQGKHVQEWQQDEDEAVSQPMLSTTPEVSVVVPTSNEQENIRPLLEALQTALGGLCVEVIFVDDSDDDTPAVIEDAAR